MKNADINLDMGNIGSGLTKLMKRVGIYRGFIFFLAVAALYGYIVWRINVYSNAPANQDQANAQIATQPHIDPATVQKMQQLQNNSVSVQALFNQARENPFQE